MCSTAVASRTKLFGAAQALSDMICQIISTRHTDVSATVPQHTEQHAASSAQKHQKSGSEKSKKSVFQVGDLVCGYYCFDNLEGWFDATISQRLPGESFLVDWEDGDETDRVKNEKRLRHRAEMVQVVSKLDREIHKTRVALVKEQESTKHLSMLIATGKKTDKQRQKAVQVELATAREQRHTQIAVCQQQCAAFEAQALELAEQQAGRLECQRHLNVLKAELTQMSREKARRQHQFASVVASLEAQQKDVQIRLQSQERLVTKLQIARLQTENADSVVGSTHSLVANNFVCTIARGGCGRKFASQQAVNIHRGRGCRGAGNAMSDVSKLSADVFASVHSGVASPHKAHNVEVCVCPCV